MRPATPGRRRIWLGLALGAAVVAAFAGIAALRPGGLLRPDPAGPAATDGLCHLLTHQWTSTEDLTEHGINAKQVNGLINALGNAGCLHLRPIAERSPE